MGILWEMTHGMGWDSTHCIYRGTHETVVVKLPKLTELSLLETVDE